MKKLFSLILILIIALSCCLLLTGCDRPTVQVSSALEITDSFSGTRRISIAYPLSATIDPITDLLVQEAPSDVEGVEFTYLGVKEDGYYFELLLTFKNKTQYEETVSALLGRSANVFLSRKNTSLTHGTRMAEDFDVSELIGWVVRDTNADSSTRDLSFAYSTNTVKIASDNYDTGSTVSINDCKGSRINSISIKTANDKAGSYSRTFTFSVPNETYIADKASVEAYFLSNTLPDAKYSGWTPEGSNMIYTAIFEELDTKKLASVTSMLLDTDSVEIFYGDRDNASTPLSEGLTYEESLDTFSFIGADNGFPKLEYYYSLPQDTIHGEGSVFSDGSWNTAGEWDENGVYKAELTDGSARIRIPDGKQYSVNGINFYLTSLGDNRFRRTAEFLYPKKDGAEAMNYAHDYFIRFGADSETAEDENDLICRVKVEGTTDEINQMNGKLFGSGNFMIYSRSEGFLALTVKTQLTDYISIGNMLNSANAEKPMKYYFSSEGGDNIVTVSVDGAEEPYNKTDGGGVPLPGGKATAEYHGNIPIVGNIIIYVIAGLLLIAITAFICVRLLKPGKRRRAADPLNNPEAYTDAGEDTSEDPAPARDISQTTTFSIFELGALARNKKYVDEINKDVEQRIRERDIEEQKQDIRARELEEMSRKVYGDPQEEPEDEGDGFLNFPTVSEEPETPEEPEAAPEPDLPAEPADEPPVELDPSAILDEDYNDAEADSL